MEGQGTENTVFPKKGKERGSDKDNLLDDCEISSEPSTSKEWLKNKWEEITSSVHAQTVETSTAQGGCCDFLRACWKRDIGQENPEDSEYVHYIPAVQCERDNLCRYCRIIRRQQLNDKKKQLEVILRLYEKQLKSLNQKEADLVDKRKPSIFRKWGSVFKFTGSTDTINSIKQSSGSSSIAE